MAEEKDERLGEDLETEEDLLNFSLDDLSLDEVEQGMPDSEPDDILELVDLVDVGAKGGSQGSAKAGGSSEGVQATDKNAGDLLGTQQIDDIEVLSDKKGIDGDSIDADVANMSLDLDMTGQAKVVPKQELKKTSGENFDIDKMLGEEPIEEMDLDLDGSMGSDESFEDLIEELDTEAPAADIETDVPKEGEQREISEQEKSPEPLDAKTKPIGNVLTGVSEEKIETIVTTVVQNVVERANRDSLTDVFNEFAALREQLASGKIEDASAPLSEELTGAFEEKVEAVVTRVVEDVVERVNRDNLAEVSNQFTALKEQLASEKVDASAPLSEELTGAFEEKVEAVVTRVVGDVVERVNRDNLAEVSNQFSALKEQLASEKVEAGPHPVSEEMTGAFEEKVEAVVTRAVGDVVERVNRDNLAEVSSQFSALREQLASEKVEAGPHPVSEELTGRFEEKIEAIVTKVVEDVVERVNQDSLTEVFNEFAALKEHLVPEIMEAQPFGDDSSSALEEKIEAVVKRVSEDVIERKVAEAMSTAAEKFSTEALEVVRQSLESTTGEILSQGLEKFGPEAANLLRQNIESTSQETMVKVAEKLITETIDALKESLQSASE